MAKFYHENEGFGIFFLGIGKKRYYNRRKRLRGRENMKKLFKHLLKYGMMIGIYTMMYLVTERDFGKEQIEQIKKMIEK